MRKTNSRPIGMRPFTLSISLLLITILTACGSVDHKTDVSSEQKNELKQTINTDEKFAQLEKELDAQLGVYAMDTGTKRTVAYRPNERFAYSSTFKPLAAAFLLAQNNIENLEKVVTYTHNELVTYSPVTEQHVDTGMTLLELSEAAIRKSDNTAGNLLLEAIGGLAPFKQALVDIGDDVTQPERYETELNEFTPGDKRDTSTPRAMAANLKKVALSNFLPNGQRIYNIIKGVIW